MSARILLTLASLLFAFTALSSPSLAEVLLNPHGFGVQIGEGEREEIPLTLHNNGEEDLAFKIRCRLAEAEQGRDDRRGGPRRDEFGEIIREVNVPYINTVGMAWDPENNWLWALAWSDSRLFAFNPENEQVEVSVQIRGILGMFYRDGTLYCGGYNNNANAIVRYDTRGQALGNINSPRNLTSTTIAGDDRYLYTLTYPIAGGRGDVHVYDFDNNLQEVATIDLNEWIGDEGWGLEVIPAHQPNGLWVSDRESLYQFHVDEEWNAELVQSAEVAPSGHCGMAHDGENLWRGTYDGQTRIWYVIDDGVIESLGFELDPSEGITSANDTSNVMISLISGDVEAGVYNFIFTVQLSPPDDERAVSSIEMAGVVTIGAPVANVSGVVVDASNDVPIPGVSASLDRYLISRTTDQRGQYLFADIPVDNYQLTFSAPDYLPTTRGVELGENGAELNISLLHATCDLSIERVDEQLAPETDMHVNFSVANNGNGPLNYTVDRRLLGDANAAPWENRRNYNFGATLEDDRIEGVAFDGENFYLAGAAGADSSKVYVTNREGELVRSFDQLTHTRYGMKDLEWDGEMLWGAGEQRVYGFSTDGDSIISFNGPFNPTNCIAYDSDNDLLWLSGTTTNIAAYDREGNAAGRQLNRKGLRIYGLAYWPEDPDGYKLYIFNAPAGGVQLIHKMNVENGDTLLAYQIPNDSLAAASGAFITNTFDVYSWVMMTMHNLAPADGSDRLSIWQLDARKDWMLVEPGAGVIEPNGRQQFDLHLNAAGLPAVMFEGELVFTHDGVGSETRLPIGLDVVEGPVHLWRSVRLDFGWNLASINLQPDEENIILLTEGLVDEGVLEFVKDDGGRFYSPSEEFSNLEGWNVEDGYWLKVNRPAELPLLGTTVMADDPIQLSEGWQAISYYPRRAVEATLALSGIENVLTIAKDGAGNFYLPAYNFCNIGAMQEGKGYQIRVSADAELIYRTREEGRTTAHSSYPSVYRTPGLYPVPIPTGRNMSLLVKASNAEDGLDVAAYCDTRLVGCGVVQYGLAGIAVWGDDPLTPEIDGATEGAELTLRIRDRSGERDAVVKMVEGALTYRTDSFAVTKIDGGGVSDNLIPTLLILSAPFPNPFNSRAELEFSLPEAGRIKLSLYDLAGREAMLLVDNHFEAGRHTTVLNALNLPTGLYWIRLETDHGVKTTKALLIK